MATAISIDGLTVSYNGRANVLQDITFAVHPGETFGLIGLNGQGKTTLIKTILGLRAARAGSVAVFGRDPSDPESREHLAYLPERFDPPWFLSGIDFIHFSVRFYNRRIDLDDVNRMAQDLGLDVSALPRGVHTYSKGMRQKLGLIATMAAGADLLVLDEPMSGLDPRARVQVKTLLQSARARGMTVFLSSHILADMDEICDRVAVLHDGRTRYIGSPGDLRSQTGDLTLEKAFLSVIEEKRIAV